MHYYIDGYNLLFRILHKGDDLKKQRELLIQDLKQKILLTGLDATLVFDSQYQQDEGTRTHLNNLEIVFTAAGETADEFILQELKESKTPAKHTVVTSDKKLSWLCRRRLANTESVEDFISWLNKRYKNKLRQQKNPLKQSKLLKTEEASPQPSHISTETSPQLPKKLASAEECFGYYLKIFQQHSPISEDSKEISNRASLKKKQKKQKNASEEETYLSDLQRWQNAFENRLNDSDS